MSQKVDIQAKAREIFDANPEAKEILMYADGLGFLPSHENDATNHSLRNGLGKPVSVKRSDVIKTQDTSSKTQDKGADATEPGQESKDAGTQDDNTPEYTKEKVIEGLESQTVKELKATADDLKVEVKGTKKQDYVDALAAYIFNQNTAQ